MTLKNEKVKQLLKKVKYNGNFDNIHDIVGWLREIYHLYIWVERDTHWMGYRYTYTFDKPTGQSIGVVKYDYFEAMEDGLEDGLIRLLDYIEKPFFKSYGYKQIFDEL